MAKNRTGHSKQTESRIVNKFVPPYRNIKLFTREKIISTDFDFYKFISDIYGEDINKKLSNRNYTDVEEVIEKGEDNGMSFHDSVFTHQVTRWQCDHRCLWLSRALIRGFEYTIVQWQNNFIFIKNSDAYEAIIQEGCMDPFQFIKRMH